MTAMRIARHKPLDDLVLKVYHLELSGCQSEEQFREYIRLMLHNVDAILEALGCYVPEDRRVRRAADLVKQWAVRLRSLCTAVPKSFNDPEEWRVAATHILANYKQLRIEAGSLYQLAVPDSTFGVLRAAL